MFNKYKISRSHLKVKLSVQLSTVSSMFYSYFYDLDLKSILIFFQKKISFLLRVLKLKYLAVQKSS